MALPEPHPGLVVRYSYLWAREHGDGREEGNKSRPCAVVLTRRVVDDHVLVTVVPVTHSPPVRADEAVELPPAVKRLLGLDDERSWIVVSEVNDFIWPGPDLSRIPGSDPPRFDYGVLPPGFFRTVRERLLALAEARRVSKVPRTE